MAKFLRASVVLVALVSVSPGVRAAGDDDTIKLTVASSQATTLAWVGTMHTLVVPELDTPPRRARQPVSHSLDRGLRRLAV